MRFFGGGLNHAHTMAVHEIKARTTDECPACQSYLQRRADALAQELRDSR